MDLLTSPLCPARFSPGSARPGKGLRDGTSSCHAWELLGALGHLPCPLGITAQVMASSPGRRGSGTEREMGGVPCTSAHSCAAWGGRGGQVRAPLPMSYREFWPWLLSLDHAFGQLTVGIRSILSCGCLVLAVWVDSWNLISRSLEACPSEGHLFWGALRVGPVVCVICPCGSVCSEDKLPQKRLSEFDPCVPPRTLAARWSLRGCPLTRTTPKVSLQGSGDRRSSS